MYVYLKSLPNIIPELENNRLLCTIFYTCYAIFAIFLNRFVNMYTELYIEYILRKKLIFYFLLFIIMVGAPQKYHSQKSRLFCMKNRKPITPCYAPSCGYIAPIHHSCSLNHTAFQKENLLICLQFKSQKKKNSFYQILG